MNITMLKSKIHRATVTQSELNYVGSITVDRALMKASGLFEYEKVQVVDVDNGNRFETYVIVGEENSGTICVNGAAARLVQVGDKIIIMAYADVEIGEAESHKPKVVFVDDNNITKEITFFEKHGDIK
ncbi:MAG: aspartate 1-decarboxylase [Acutalibacteraceae bacterium]|nr:aspartate 1-decarboxylase [Acutalibacteraceae bacterium]